ncbi:MAG: Ig-like domain-containing protein, partial [Thermoplasmata archaeon]|nr:Ig-like domain-containing protein [Thermoplasmata archaeon]
TWRGHFFDEGYVHEENCLDSDGNLLARQPVIDGIKFQIIKTNDAAVSALLQSLVDYIGWSVPPTFVQELANKPGIALQQSPEQGYYYAAYNMNRKSFGYDENGTDKGRALRKAMAYCIDKNRLVQRLLLCFGIGGEGPVSSISSWFNDTIPRYAYDPDKAKDILTDAGYQLTDPSQLPGYGNWWLNPDGSPIGSGDNGTIIFISYMFTDFRCPQVNSMLVMQMQDIGLNVMEINYDYGDVLKHLQTGNYDMVATRTGISTAPPEFLYKMFHSRGGENYWGYNNASYDEIIDLARSSSDPDTVKQAVEDAQASICYDLPMDVLYFRTNIEAYRSSKFTGWSVGASGSILNKNSIYNIRGRGYQISANFVSPPSAVVSNSTENQITVFVRNADGEPLSNAHIVLNASMGKLADEKGLTNNQGKFTTTFTAPYVSPLEPDYLENGMKTIIQIKSATYDDGCSYYDPAPPRLTLITVYPEDVSFLSLTMSADPDIIDPDYSEENGFGFTYVYVFVKDQNGAVVTGAVVALSISPAIPDIEPAEILSDENGKARFKITATDEPNDSGESVEYQVTAYAQYKDYKPGDNSIEIQIIDTLPIEPEVSWANSWDYYFVLPAALIGILILMVAMLIYVRRVE